MIMSMRNFITKILSKRKNVAERYAHAKADSTRKLDKDVLPHEFVRYADSWLMNRANM